MKSQTTIRLFLFSITVLLSTSASVALSPQKEGKSKKKSSTIESYSKRVQQLEEQARRLTGKNELSEDEQRMSNFIRFQLVTIYGSLGRFDKCRVCISHFKDQFWKEISHGTIAKCAARNGDFDLAASSAKKTSFYDQHRLLETLSIVFCKRNDLESALNLQNMISGEQERYISHLRLLRTLLSEGKKQAVQSIRNKRKFNSAWDKNRVVLRELAAIQLIEGDEKAYKSTLIKLKNIYAQNKDRQLQLDRFHWYLASETASNTSRKTMLKIINKIDDRITKGWCIRDAVREYIASGRISDAMMLVRNTNEDSACILLVNHLSSKGKFADVLELVKLIDDLPDKFNAIIQIQKNKPPLAIRNTLLAVLLDSTQEKQDVLKKYSEASYVYFLTLLGEFFARIPVAARAERCLQKALKLEKKLDYTTDSGFTFRFDIMTQIGKVYRILGNKTEALKFQSKAVRANMKMYRYFGFSHYWNSEVSEISRELIRLEAYDVLNKALGKNASDYYYTEIAYRIENSSDFERYRKWAATVSNPFIKLEVQLTLMRREMKLAGFPLE